MHVGIALHKVLDQLEVVEQGAYVEWRRADQKVLPVACCGTATAAANARVVDLADVPLALVLIVAGNANGRGRGCTADTAAHEAAAAIKKLHLVNFIQSFATQNMKQSNW